MKAMRTLVFCFVLLCGAVVLRAQAPQWQWAVQAGGTNDDAGRSITVDDQGNQYVTGYFEGTATFGTYTLTSSGNSDIFAAKLDPAGSFLWAVQAGGAEGQGEEGIGIAMDNAGNAYLTGRFSGTATFGPYTLTSSGGSDIFAAKLDPAGNWLWAIKAGGISSDYGLGISVNSAGNAYLTGYFRATATFGTHTLTSSGYDEIFAAKLDPAGNWLWAVKAGGSGFDYGYGIALEGTDNSLLTGSFEGTATFGPHTLTSGGETDIFAAKLDPAGNWLWAVKAGGVSSDYGYGIAVDSAGNACLTGQFFGTAAFGPHTITSSGGSDIFAAKLDPAGNWLWVVKAGGTNHDYGVGITVNNVGNAYLTGVFNGTATFGPHTLTSSGGWDIYAAKLDPAGNWLWAVRAGGASDDGDGAVGIAVDNTGNAYLTGQFFGTATFGPHTLTSSGDGEIFAAKLGGGTPVEDDLAPEVAALARLYDARPNPFRQGESTLIKAVIAERSTGTLRIFNLRGQVVASHELGPGTHQITLDSRDLAAGIYMYNLQSGHYRETKKLVLLK